MQKKRFVILSFLLTLVCLVSLLAVPAGATQEEDKLQDGIIVTIDAEYCGCCHTHQHSGFFGKLSCFFCKIMSFFKNIFGNAEENPEHKYVLTKDREASCSLNGQRVYTCMICDKTETFTFEKLEHTLEILPAVQATCTQTGLTEGCKCTVCKKVIVAQKKIPKTEHAYDEGIITEQPDCTMQGVRVRTCVDCSATTSEKVAALGHTTAAVNAKAVTCEEIGWDAYEYCTVCDYTTYVEIPATGHSIEQVSAKESTCEEIGWDAYEYCSVCDYTTCKEIPASGHAYVGAVTTQPTCTETGIKTFTCKNDSNHTYTETVAANGHNIENVNAQAATCIAIGWEAYEYCTACDYTTYAEIPALGHTTTVVNAKAATCEDIGWEAYEYCSVCDYTTYKEIPASGHAYVGAVTTQPTCTEAGIKTFTCKNDSNHTYTETVAANGHNIENVNAQAATCIAIGWEAYEYCTACDYTTYAEIPALGHTMTAVNGKAATCETIGWEAYEYCSVCDYTTYKEIPARGHAYDGVATTPSTCTTTGVMTYTCRNDVSETYTEILPATGHSEPVNQTVQCYAYNDTAKAGLVTESYVCTKCNQTVTTDYNRYDAVVFTNNGLRFCATVGEALANAVSGETVVVAKDAVLSQDAVVPSGVTLLIPCDNAMSGYNSNGYNPDGTDRYGTAKLYRTLTINEGITLTVNGTLLINAVTGRPEGGSAAGYNNSGNYGQIALAGNIIVNNGGLFDCSGFVTNEGGKVTILSGGKMYETYAIQKWRGGSYAFSMSYTPGLIRNKGCYPIYEFHMNNMRAELRIEHGATVAGTVKMYAGDTNHACRCICFDDSAGLVRLESGAYAIRQIDEVNNREVYSFYGNTNWVSSSLTLKNPFDIALLPKELTLKSNHCDFYFYDGDMTFHFYEGKHTMQESIAFLPGAQLYAHAGATIVCNAKAGIALFNQDFYNIDVNCMGPVYAYTAGRPDAQMTLYAGSKVDASVSNAQFVGNVLVQEGAEIITSSNTPASVTLNIASLYNDDANEFTSYTLTLNAVPIS